MTDEPNNKSSTWERDVLQKVLLESVNEQRKARRWGIAFKLMILAYIGIGLWMVADPFSGKTSVNSGSHTAVIDIAGPIADGADTNAETVMEGLKNAVEDHATKGVILRMNSPGGSPVQSAYLWEGIRQLKKDHSELPIVAVVADVCASGCYYIASAADSIYVNGSSVVGSIGVIMYSFGFVDAMNKMGIERRLLTAGEHKALLDPFSPVSEVEKSHIQQNVLNSIHIQFIQAVRQGRGDRLKESPDMFSGLVWTGEDGIKLGLVDSLGDVHSVAKNVIGAEKIVNFTPKERLIDRITTHIGTTLGLALQTAAGSAFNLR
jgi:protease-4